MVAFFVVAAPPARETEIDGAVRSMTVYARLPSATPIVQEFGPSEK